MKQLKILALYTIIVTVVFCVLFWRIETLPTRLEQTLQTVSNQMAIDDGCVGEDEYYQD